MVGALFIILVRCPVHTPVRTPMYGLSFSQSDQRIHSVFQSVYNNALVHVPTFGGLSGSGDKGGGDNSIQFINFGRVGDKSFKEWRQKIGGGRVGDHNILTFRPTVYSIKKCHFLIYFYTRFLFIKLK